MAIYLDFEENIKQIEDEIIIAKTRIFQINNFVCSYYTCFNICFRKRKSFQFVVVTEPHELLGELLNVNLL